MANPKAHLLVNPWYQEEEDFKVREGVSKYTIVSFIPPVQNFTAMLSRLHREAHNTFFKAEWILLAHGVMSVGIFFNWVGILFANTIRTLEKEVPRLEAKGYPFYFSGFLLDSLCASNQFPGLKWA